MDTSNNQETIGGNGERSSLAENTEHTCSLLFRFAYCILCVRSVLLACVYVHHIHVWYSQKPEEGVRIPGTGVTNGSRLPLGAGN